MIKVEKMTKEKFSEILRKYNYSEKLIDLLWDSRPTDELNEKQVERTAKKFSPIKDSFVQA